MNSKSFPLELPFNHLLSALTCSRYFEVIVVSSKLVACVTAASPRKKIGGESLFRFFFRGEAAVTQATELAGFNCILFLKAGLR